MDTNRAERLHRAQLALEVSGLLADAADLLSSVDVGEVGAAASRTILTAGEAVIRSMPELPSTEGDMENLTDGVLLIAAAVLSTPDVALLLKDEGGTPHVEARRLLLAARAALREVGEL